MARFASNPYRDPPAIAATPLAPALDAVEVGLVVGECFLLFWCLLRVGVDFMHRLTPEGAVAAAIAVATAAMLATFRPADRDALEEHRPPRRRV
jgi:hypothetical protein